MIETQSCKACGQTKAADAFERLPTGGLRGTCTPCRRAVAADRKRAIRQAYEATPEYLALAAQREADRAARSERKEAERLAAVAARSALLAEQASRREEARQARAECEAALRDDLWAAMYRGRSERALQGVKVRAGGIHRIPLKYDGGFVSIAELACRHAEREACARAAKCCKTFEAVADAVRVLERATPTLERTREMRRLWREALPPRGLFALQDIADDPDGEGFEEAFGDWAPAWMNEPALAA